MRIIDSHTGGEPTRIVVQGGPDLGTLPLEQQLDRMRAEFDHIRRALVLEPRGSDVVVGALLRPPVHPGSTAGVIFFNNVGYLGMCGHGSMGLMATLAYLGRIQPGSHRIDTPVGTITAHGSVSGEITLANVPSYRWAHGVSVRLGERVLHGDVAWGGNWFFLCADHGMALTPDNAPALREFCLSVREALRRQGICGAHHAEIDHIELTGPALNRQVLGPSGRNFVLCPGGAYDRSPCGTGTSAKVACLAADGVLKPGEVWTQESVIGSQFEAWYEASPSGHIVPTLRGRAWVTMDAQVITQEGDPFAWGMPLA
jgi:4-hydroxyproline epimerase